MSHHLVRPKNIREYLIRAKVPMKPDSRPQRLLKGMQKCKDQCTACPYILEGKNIKKSIIEAHGQSTENLHATATI